jgi:hypothetical protein
MEEIGIRRATIEDLGLILHHRTAMFSDMGYRDESRLALMRASSEAFLRSGLVDGTYRGWLAASAGGRVVAGGGVAIVPWSGSPEDPAPRRGWVQNVYTEPPFRHRGLAVHYSPRYTCIAEPSRTGAPIERTVLRHEGMPGVA